MAIKTFVLDAGHGGTDSGASGNGIKEKDIVLKIVQLMRSYLEQNYKDIRIELTRGSDKFIELNDRAKFANNLNATAFVSVHINAAANSSAEGMETYVFTGASNASKNLQLKVHNSIVKNAPFFVDRKPKSANFAVLRNTKMASILTETGFISNAKDAAVLKDNAKLTKIAHSIAIGIAEAYALVKKSPTTPTAPQNSYKVGKTFDNKAEAEALLASLIRDGHKGFTVYTEK